MLYLAVCVYDLEDMVTNLNNTSFLNSIDASDEPPTIKIKSGK